MLRKATGHTNFLSISNVAQKFLDASPNRFMVVFGNGGPTICYIYTDNTVSVTKGLQISQNQKWYEVYGDLARAEWWVINTAAPVSSFFAIEYFENKDLEEYQGND